MTLALQHDHADTFSHRVNTRSVNERVSTEQFLRGMRTFARAVNVITTHIDGVSYGLTATSVCSLSAEPPRLLACINLKGTTFDAIRRNGVFAVNALAVDQGAVALRFGGGGEADTDRFDTGGWQSGTVTDAPVLQGACCSFECAVCDVIDCGTHALLIADILHVSPAGSAAPLVYHDQTFCGLLEL